MYLNADNIVDIAAYALILGLFHIERFAECGSSFSCKTDNGHTIGAV